MHVRVIWHWLCSEFAILVVLDSTARVEEATEQNPRATLDDEETPELSLFE